MRPLVWLRSDLRVADNTALHRACADASRGVIAIVLVAPGQWKSHDWGDAKVEFLLRTLGALTGALLKLGVPLLVREAESFAEAPDVLLDVAVTFGCDAIYFNREHEVNERRRDEVVTSRFVRAGLGVQASCDQTIVAPGALRTNTGGFYSVFGPFRKRWMARLAESGAPSVLGRPRRQPALAVRPDAVPVRVRGFGAGTVSASTWPAGERAALGRLESFARGPIARYATDRDRPDLDGTSRLSPYLALGAVSIRQCLAAALDAAGGEARSGAACWIDELVWRDFYRHVLVGFPRVSMHGAFRRETDRLPWRHDEEEFGAWCAGRTGFPIVDAAMRQLAETGWMHNRLRMVTATFLAKSLFIDWRWGEKWFMRHLVDGDLASNNGGWQWAASTGTDAAPYFRVFNPIRQSRRFDPEGRFIRRFVQELDGVDDREIHEPVRGSYVEPIVDLAKGRERVVRAFARAKRSR